MSVYEKLNALNIELPAVAAPVAAYVMYAQTGNTVFVSGHIAKKDGKPWVGQLGRNIATDEGKQAARADGRHMCWRFALLGTATFRTYHQRAARPQTARRRAAPAPTASKSGSLRRMVSRPRGFVSV